MVWKYKSKTIREGSSWKNDSGVRHPSNWHIWTDSEKTAAGLKEIVLESPPNSTLYNWNHDSDGKIIKTARKLDDENAKDSDGKLIKDIDGNQVINHGVKWILKQEVAKQQYTLLSQTDWAIIRKSDKGTAVPSNIQTWRDAVRTKATEMETAIDNAADTDALEALFVVFDKDGKQTGILYDWPKLGS